MAAVAFCTKAVTVAVRGSLLGCYKKKLSFFNEITFRSTQYDLAHGWRGLNTGRYLLSEVKFTKDHEWIKEVDGVGTVGVTDYAQDKLGDVVYVELPEVGSELSQGDGFGALESVKAASDLYSPVSGEVVEANQALEEEPGLINKSPYDEGWIGKIKLSVPDELNSLLSEEDYKTFLQEEEA